MHSMGRIMLAIAAAVCLTATLASAQSSSTSTETKQFEVIAVDGNNLVIKMAEGTRELTVPESFRFTVDGKQVSVHELKPGMTGTATITTKTTMTPVTVTEVKNGTVAQVGGSRIVVRTDEGLRAFTQGELDKRGVKIMRDGRIAQVSDFHVGDQLTATIITSLPPTTVTEKDVQATLAAAPPPTPPAAVPSPAAEPPGPIDEPAKPVAVATTGAAAPEAQAAPQPAQLPKTASPMPLIGLVGLSALALAATLAIRRRRLPR